VHFCYKLLQFLNLDRKTAWAAFCPHKSLFVEALIFLRELVFMVITRERIFWASTPLWSAWMRCLFQASRAVTSALLVSINFGCWTCIVRVFQPFPCCNRTEQLIPPRQSLSFLLLPFRSLSPFLLFIICLPGSIIKVTSTKCQSLHSNFVCSLRWWKGTTDSSKYYPSYCYICMTTGWTVPIIWK
jgi:hypothetical protein